MWPVVTCPAVCCGCVQDGRIPEQKIKLRHGDTLLIDSMEGNTMMNFFKRFLAGGFQVRVGHWAELVSEALGPGTNMRMCGGRGGADTAEGLLARILCVWQDVHCAVCCLLMMTQNPQRMRGW